MCRNTLNILDLFIWKLYVEADGTSFCSHQSFRIHFFPSLQFIAHRTLGRASSQDLTLDRNHEAELLPPPNPTIWSCCLSEMFRTWSGQIMSLSLSLLLRWESGKGKKVQPRSRPTQTFLMNHPKIHCWPFSSSCWFLQTCCCLRGSEPEDVTEKSLVPRNLF